MNGNDISAIRQRGLHGTSRWSLYVDGDAEVYNARGCGALGVLLAGDLSLTIV